VAPYPPAVCVAPRPLPGAAIAILVRRGADWIAGDGIGSHGAGQDGIGEEGSPAPQASRGLQLPHEDQDQGATESMSTMYLVETERRLWRADRGPSVGQGSKASL